MKKQLLYLMFTMAIMCIACSDDNEIYQTETVENPVTGFSIENDLLTEEGVITLEGLGTTTTLHVSVIPDNAGDWEKYSFRFGSSDINIFTVDREGIITSVASGEAELTVTLVNNVNVVQFQSKYRVVVNNVVKVEEIIVAGGFERLSLKIGDIYDLNANLTVLPDNAADKSVSYTLKEGNGVVSLQDGIIEVIGVGVAVIEIMANDGSGISKELTVEANDASDIDVYFEFTTARALSMDGNLVLNFMDKAGNAAAVLIKQQTALLPGKYSKAQIDEISYADLRASDLGKNRNFDIDNPGSFTVQYDETTQIYTIKGVFNLSAIFPYPAISMGFEYTGHIQ